MKSLMVIKLLASARNSPMAPWAVGLLFLLSLVCEALLNKLKITFDIICSKYVVSI